MHVFHAIPFLPLSLPHSSPPPSAQSVCIMGFYNLLMSHISLIVFFISSFWGMGLFRCGTPRTTRHAPHVMMDASTHTHPGTAALRALRRN